MSEQDSTIRPADDEDVEAHNKKKLKASDEAPKDDEADDDVELHGAGRSKVK